jgi:hypothetical protein
MKAPDCEAPLQGAEEQASFSPTEKRVYENILPYGISARQLAEKTEISLRRTCKYLRRLK